jgi:hypothetical protein
VYTIEAAHNPEVAESDAVTSTLQKFALFPRIFRMSPVRVIRHRAKGRKVAATRRLRDRVSACGSTTEVSTVSTVSTTKSGNEFWTEPRGWIAAFA